MDEKIKILEMLEKGKITVEESLKLLEAIESSSETNLSNIGSYIAKLVKKELKKIPEVININRENWKEYFSKEDESEYKEYSFNNIHSIKLKNTGGGSSVKGKKTDLSTIKTKGEIEKENGRLTIKSIAGDTKITCNKEIDLEIKDLAGNTEVSNIEGSITIKNLAGNVNLKEIAGHLEVKSTAGNVTIETPYQIEGTIKVTAGNVEILVNKDSDFIINPRVDLGEIEIEENIKTTEENKIVIGKGSKILNIRVTTGNIIVRRI